MRYALASEAMRGGSSNEDAARADPSRGIFVVADGMGGAAAGEVASAMAADAAFERLCAWFDSGEGEPRVALAEAARAAGARIRERAGDNPETRGMGSTIVACIIRGDRLYAMNVGDSRAYVARGQGMVLVSEDHSLVAGMLRSGAIDGREARAHKLRHVLSRVLGQEEAPDPAIREMALRKGDLVLLCSDGVTEALDDEAMAIALHTAGRDPAKVSRALVEAGSARDDSTAIVVEFAP